MARGALLVVLAMVAACSIRWRCSVRLPRRGFASEEFAELRPRLTWDRQTDVLIGRKGARLLSVVSGGTIPDRGTYAVHAGRAPCSSGAWNDVRPASYRHGKNLCWLHQGNQIPMSTTKPSTKPPTLADLEALPPGVVGEIIEGVLYTMTKPRARHQRTTLKIGGGVGGPFDDGLGGPGGWWIITEPGIELPNNTPEIVPDVAGWRRDRMPELPLDEPIRVVPDWVCEILSPTTRRHDLLVKLPYYARIGVAYHWLVDLEARAVTAQRLESARWVTIGVYGDETEARIEPFDVVPLNVASWWPPSAPASQR